MTDDITLAFVQESLQRNERWITLADAKAGAVLVLVPALASLCGETIVDYTKERLRPILDAEISSSVGYSVFYGVIVAALVVFAVLALHSAYTTLTPRLLTKHQPSPGVVYFRHVAGRSLDAWKTDIASLTEKQLLEDFVEQVYATSQVCNDKFDHVNDSLRWGAWFFITSVIAYTLTLLF